MASFRARALLLGFVGSLAAWWMRLIAHSKTPPPEGRWREYSPRDAE